MITFLSKLEENNLLTIQTTITFEVLVFSYQFRLILYLVQATILAFRIFLLMHLFHSRLFVLGFISTAARSLFQGPKAPFKMSTMSMSSQPQQNQQINVDNYLSVTSYTTKGSALRLKDHTEFYASGSPQSKNGVIIIPDYWGWNTGRIRNICDLFGDLNCFAVIPNFSSRGVEGESTSKFLLALYSNPLFSSKLHGLQQLDGLVQITHI